MRGGVTWWCQTSVGAERKQSAVIRVLIGFSLFGAVLMCLLLEQRHVCRIIVCAAPIIGCNNDHQRVDEAAV